MRRLLAFFAILLFFAASCNDDDKVDDSTQPVAVNLQQQLKDLVNKYPDSIALRETLIQNYRDSGDYENAIDQAKTTIEIDSTNAALWDHLFWLYFEDEDTAKAIASLQKAITMDPSPEYIIRLGTVYAQTKNDTALLIANNLYADSSADHKKESLFIKGLYYSTTGQNAKAIPFFDQSINLDYTYLDAYREEAICLYNMGKYDDAIKKSQTAASVKSDNADAYYWMARCDEKLNKKADAINNYQLTLQIDPDYGDAKDALQKLQ